MKFIRKSARNGHIGEEVACQFLIKKGWRILARNQRNRSDEVDIVAIDTIRVLVFVEVKALVKRGGFSPEDNLSAAKLRKLNRTAQFFARQIFARRNQDLIDDEIGWRIDLIAVDLSESGNPIAMRHYKNI